MGQIHASTRAESSALHIGRGKSGERIVALAGNPNVGKSTVFNSLTGLNQHTGNWPGKTVSTAQGRLRREDTDIVLVDLPGTYSLLASSVEETLARDVICFGDADAVILVADATCLERNLNLVLQTIEITGRAVLCVNLMDEAAKKKISIDLDCLAVSLGIPVVGTNARHGDGLDALIDAAVSVASDALPRVPYRVTYPKAIETAVSILAPAVADETGDIINARWLSLRLLEGADDLFDTLGVQLGRDIRQADTVAQAIAAAEGVLTDAGLTREKLRDALVTTLVEAGETIARDVVSYGDRDYTARDRRLDKLLTSKRTGIPIMIALLFGVFWLTITGANYPSALLADGLFWVEGRLGALFVWLSAPDWVRGLIVDGMYRTLAWVVSVMLPPMAIFFPLFTLLEDSGYLPRIAFNLDNFFRRACAHGKQALTMCMGFGCNAAGVVGCRIIDSPRERLIAILTNNFVPCNGRFPTLIAIITMFFAGGVLGAFGSLVSTLMLTGVIVLGVTATVLVSKLLSKTILKGLPSSFNLELPPYRRPQIGRVIVRSILDRTLFVLGRAAAVAAPAGLVIWAMANIQSGGVSLLNICAGFLDPFGRLLGMDGFIVLAFILGFPANEIIVPILIMSYMASGSLTELASLGDLHALFIAHGWTWVTAVCVMLFTLLHWPCGTTCWTIGKETKSAKWTLASVLIPTAAGVFVCFIVAAVCRLLGLV